MRSVTRRHRGTEDKLALRRMRHQAQVVKWQQALNATWQSVMETHLRDISPDAALVTKMAEQLAKRYDLRTRPKSWGDLP